MESTCAHVWLLTGWNQACKFIPQRALVRTIEGCAWEQTSVCLRVYARSAMWLWTVHIQSQILAGFYGADDHFLEFLLVGKTAGCEDTR